jgi:hypothetical protein
MCGIESIFDFEQYNICNMNENSTNSKKWTIMLTNSRKWIHYVLQIVESAYIMSHK